MSTPKKLDSTAVQTLENLVREGKVDGLMPSKIQRGRCWSTLFGRIPGPTFRSRLGRIQKSMKNLIQNVILFFVYYIYEII